MKKLSGKRDGDSGRLGASRGAAGSAEVRSADRVSHVRRLEVHCWAKGSISMIAVNTKTLNANLGIAHQELPSPSSQEEVLQMY